MALLILAGCASGPKVFQIKGEAGAVINRDATGKPLSVLVRLYQLKEAGEFSKLTFDTLATGRPESDLLGADLLEQNEVILVPGGKYTGSEKIKDEAKYIGIVAFFREPDRHYWRFLVDASKARSEGLSFKLQDCYLMLENLKPAPIPGQPDDAKPSCANVNALPVIARPQEWASSTRPQKRSSNVVKPTLIEQSILNKP